MLRLITNIVGQSNKVIGMFNRSTVDVKLLLVKGHCTFLLRILNDLVIRLRYLLNQYVYIIKTF